MKAGGTETVEVCVIAHNEDCYPKDAGEEEHLLAYLEYHQGNRTSIKPEKGPKVGPTVTLFNGHYYYYRHEVLQEILDWNCGSSFCDLHSRRCTNDPAKLAKRKALRFYEYEADMEKMKPRAAASILSPSTFVFVLSLAPFIHSFLIPYIKYTI